MAASSIARRETEHSEYRQRWEGEAAEDHVRSAIATGQTERVDYGTLTGKIAPVWQRFPRGRHFGTVLEIGAGYGRIPLYLARERDITWSTYCAVDISGTMLERFVEYRDQFAPAPESRLYPITNPSMRCRSKTTASISRSRAPSSCTWASGSSATRLPRSRGR